MTEFAGYIATTPVNWGKVAQEASKGIFDVLEEREKERKKLDDLSADAQREIGNFERSRTRGINNTIMAGAQSGRSYIQAQNDLLRSGQITPEQYKRNVENAKVGFKTFDTFLKTVGDDLEKHRTRIDNGSASQQEIYLYNRRMGMLDFAGKSIQYGPSGSFYVKAETGELYDVSSELDPSNRFIDKVQLDSEAFNFVKTLGMTSKIDPKTGKYTVSQNIDDETLEKGVEGILQSNKDKMASVLIDNAQKYSYTDNPEEAKKDKNKILLAQDSNGVFRPQLTEEQEKEARNYTKKVIEGKLSYKEKDVSMTDYQKAMLEESKANRAQAREVLKLKKKEYARKTGKEMEPLMERAMTIKSLKENGNKSEYSGMITGQVLPYMQGIGKKADDDKIGQRYEGFVISALKKAEDGKIDVLVKRKEKEDGEEEFVNIRFNESEFEAEVNSLLNKTENTKVRTAQLINYAFTDEPTTTTTTTTQGKAAGDSIFK